MRLDFKEWLFYSEGHALRGSYKGNLFQRLVAAAYKIAPVAEPEAEPLYQSLAKKIARQQQFLRHDYNFIPDSGDHYNSLKQLKRSVNAQRAGGNRRADMYVYAEPPGPSGQPAQQGHPVLSNDQNVMFRGVHDAIAHLAGNHPFSARGEYGAYLRHLKTLCDTQSLGKGGCPEAAILFTEIVGQTSYYYVYGGFPPQKAVILRDFDHWRVGRLSPDSPLNEFFEVVGKDFMARQGFDQEAFSRLPVGREFLSQESMDVKRPAPLQKLAGPTN